jgi:preprotein translocase subunit SecB
MTTPGVPVDLKLRIAQILLEKVEFRHRSDFLERTEPKAPPGESTLLVNVVSDDAAKKAVVRLEIDCRGPDAFYIYNARYLVIFQYEGKKPDKFSDRLGVTGATMLQPYLRELISNLTSRGRFGPVILGPVNFSKALNKETEVARRTPKRKKRAKAQSTR